jgi:hypothetical protein
MSCSDIEWCQWLLSAKLSFFNKKEIGLQVTTELMVKVSLTIVLITKNFKYVEANCNLLSKKNSCNKKPFDYSFVDNFPLSEYLERMDDI